MEKRQNQNKINKVEVAGKQQSCISRVQVGSEWQEETGRVYQPKWGQKGIGIQTGCWWKNRRGQGIWKENIDNNWFQYTILKWLFYIDYFKWAPLTHKHL